MLSSMTVAIIALVLGSVGLFFALIGLVLSLRLQGRLAMRPTFSQSEVTHPDETDKKTHLDTSKIDTWVIYNPVKVAQKSAFSSEADFQKVVTKVAHSAGYPDPTFIATTEDDPGAGMTKKALDEGAKLVIAAGGDGTVRKVAGALAGTHVPMGIIPLGTGNLLALNLRIPIGYPEQALERCFTGRYQILDVGFMSINDDKDEEPFTVIAGFGFDGDIMANTNENLKDSIGKNAYVVSGVRSIRRRPMKLSLQLGQAEEKTNLRAHTLMFANCGLLGKGVPLLPDADPTDGWLDIARLDVRAGIIGWFEVIAGVMLRAIGMRKHIPMLTSSLDVSRSRTATATAVKPQQTQIDGDPIGKATVLKVRVEPSAVFVRR